MTGQAAALVLFWLCFAVIAWVYFGYPLTLRYGLFGKAEAKAQAGRASAFFPNVSVIVPARNEEGGIEAKLRNLLDSDYPRERVEILVGSDGSSDRTEEIVERFRRDGVGLISFPEHRGKSAIQNGLVAVASGSILVFTDADCLLPRDALRRLLDNFSDPCVGLVTGRPHYRNASETPTAANEGLYLRYESWLRKLESERGLLAVASGSLFAIRRSLWRPLDANLGDDFALPLHVARMRKRNVLELRACPITALTQNSLRTMLQLKIRVISKDFRALLENRDLLNPMHYGRIAVTLWSHKLLRWMVPYLLLVLLGTNAFLLHRPFFEVAMALQSSFYALAVCGIFPRDTPRSRLCSVPASFCTVNCAAALGTLKCLAGRTSGLWTPERLTSAPGQANRRGVPAD